MSTFEIQQPHLTPSNASIVGVFPPNNQRASNSAYLAELRRVFPNAVEISDQLGAFGGVFSGLGMLAIICSFGFLIVPLVRDLENVPLEVFMYATFLIGLAFSYIFIRLDGTGYDAAPTLLNRSNATVTEFLPKISLLSFRRPTFTVATHDWRCVRGELMKVLVGGASNAHHEYALMLAVTDKPGSERVIRRFRVGMSSLSPDGVAALWEYLRRYMQYEGPALTEKGTLRAYEEPKLPLWRMWFRLQAFLGPDVNLYNFSGSGLAKVVSFFFAFLAPLVFPFTAILGFGGWVANQLRTPMEWPEKIIAEVGGPALTEEQARAKAKDYSQEAAV